MTWTAIARRLSLALAICMVGAFDSPWPDPKQWNVNNTTELLSATDYELYNGTSQIGYRDQSSGPDLGWVGHSGGHFQFMRQAEGWAGAPSGTVRDHRRRPVPPTESVALYNTLKRQWLTAGLTWANRPAYEWRVMDQSAAGGRVHFALWNARKQMYLVRLKRSSGIDLDWSPSSGGKEN